jgi:ribosomal protein S12 methylthiotransferase
MTVVVDGHGADGNAIARSAADAPEIDGTVLIRQGSKLATGTFARVVITAATEHDLAARVAR